MTLQNAFQFLIQLRSEGKQTQKNSLPPLSQDLTLDALAKQGEAVGLSFTPGELRTAFKHDWAMRWQRYHSTSYTPTQ